MKKNESQKSLKSQSSELSPNSNSSAPETATPTNRKTTTWNVKRTQTNPNVDANQTPSEVSSTSSLLGRTQSINKNSGVDSSDHVENGLGHIEPGSPMFAKELLSIRYFGHFVNYIDSYSLSFGRNTLPRVSIRTC